jgi:hypothetical protein
MDDRDPAESAPEPPAERAPRGGGPGLAEHGQAVREAEGAPGGYVVDLLGLFGSRDWLDGYYDRRDSSYFGDPRVPSCGVSRARA